MTLQFMSPLILSLSLSGCALEETRQQLMSSLKEAEGRFQRAQNKYSLQRESSGSLEITRKPLLGNKAVSLKNEHPLPPVYERPQAVSIRTALPQSLYQIAEFISHDLGIPTRVDNLTLSSAQKADGFDNIKISGPSLLNISLRERCQLCSREFPLILT